MAVVQNNVYQRILKHAKYEKIRDFLKLAKSVIHVKTVHYN